MSTVPTARSRTRSCRTMRAYLAANATMLCPSVSLVSPGSQQAQSCHRESHEPSELSSANWNPKPSQTKPRLFFAKRACLVLVDSPGEARAECVSCVVSGPGQRRGAGTAAQLTGMLRVSVARFSGADRAIRRTISPEEGRRSGQRSAAAGRSSRKGGQGARAGRDMCILKLPRASLFNLRDGADPRPGWRPGCT
jgi:hypothetical protein